MRRIGADAAAAAASCAKANPLINSRIAMAAFQIRFISSPVTLSRIFLRAVFLVSDLFQLVEQGFVADLQFLRRPAPVPARARQNLQD